jgi:hypothetical protein
MTIMTVTSAYPVRVDAHLDPHLSRWLWLVKWVLVIPHFIVLIPLWIAFCVVSVIAFFAILLTGPVTPPALRIQRRRDALDLAGQPLRLQRARHPTSTRPSRSPKSPTTQRTCTCPTRSVYPADLVLVKWWLRALPQLLIVGILAGGGTWLALDSDT